MIDELLPPAVASEVSRFDDGSAYLFPEEREYVAAAIEGRKREYALGRSCARRALSRLGFPEAALLSGPKREPLWPASVVGSITHCNGFCAAAVANRSELLTLGIDAEEHDALPAGVLPLISLPIERAQLAHAPPCAHWDRLLFSAKEATYKAYFPLTRAWLGFEQAELRFDANGTFTARLLVAPIRVGTRQLDTFHGRYRIRDGLVLTAIAMTV